MIIWPGLRRVVSAVQRLFNSASFYAPLTRTLELERGAGSPTYTRATTATFDDWEGVLRTVPAGCARFQNGRMVRNLFTNTGWSGAVSGTYGTPPTGWTAGVGTGTLTVSDSADYSGHKQIQFSGTAQRPFIYQTVSVAANSVYIESVRLIEHQADYSAVNNLITGVSLPAGATQEYLINGVVVAASTVPEAGDVISYRLRTAGTAGTPNIRVGLGCQIGSTGSTTFVAPQWEDVTGQADQTASEYVSVGVLSAPYHGAGADGVEFFDTDRSDALLSPQPAYLAETADVLAYQTASNILAAASTVYLEFTPDHTPSGTIALWGTYVDASNYTAILHDATNMIMRKRIAGVNYDATIANAFTANTTYKVCGSWGASGVTITLDGTEGTPHANTTAAQIAATMQWGADGNSLQQPFATERNARVWQRQLSASERVAITS